MKKKNRVEKRVALTALAVAFTLAWANPGWSAPEETPATESETGVPTPAIEPVETEDGLAVTPPAIVEENRAENSERLGLGLRLDSAFSAGAPAQQGFAVPSVRVTLHGDISTNASYRLSLGQTREFSTVMLPQILPVEAYIDIATGRNDGMSAESLLNWRIGMFTPTFNPWWTPDLTDVDLPDYHETHKQLFISRDLGTEISYEVRPGGLKFGAGAFNGNGIVALNSNSSKAFTGYLSQGIQFPGLKWTLGASGYTLVQSDPDSINYKSYLVGNVYSAFHFEKIALDLKVEFFAGSFRDSTQNFSSAGGAGTLYVGILPWLRLFTRGESVSNPVTTQFAQYRHFQIGPSFYLGEGLKAYTFYDYADSGTGHQENSFHIRLRLVI